MMVMVMSLILLTFPRESRGKAMGLVSLVIGFAPAIGPTLGGLLVDVVGWRALFCIVVAFSVLIILFAARALKNREGFPRTSADAPSIIFHQSVLRHFFTDCPRLLPLTMLKYA